MDCARFDRRLDELLDGSCTASEWKAAEEHARGCARCGLLLDGLAGVGEQQDASEADGLSAAVIARTSGNTCGAARDRLGDLVDRQLGEFDRELVEAHLSRCQACRELAGALALASDVLPSFASLEVPFALLPSVLAVTSRRPPVPALGDRLAGWFERLAARPRFSLEAAYICTLLIALVFGNPVAAFKETSARGVSYAQPRVEEIVGRVTSRPLESARTLRGALADRALATSAAAERGVFSRFVASVDGGWKWFTTYVAQPASALASRLVSWVSETLVSNTEGTTERPGPAAPSR
jgi:predicted anti-sigma-YlaC factor YlaD